MRFVSYTYPGLESILKKEIENRKISVKEFGPGFVVFEGNESTLVKANLWLRTANKVYILLAEENIVNFNKLFDLVYYVDWNKYIPKNFGIVINPHSIRSKLSSLSSIQSIVQKAIIKKLVGNKIYAFSKDSKIEIRVDIFKDNVKILLDTSGTPLYKRGYKKFNSKASLKETLAAGIVLLTNCKEGIFYDPFCGSGTILIEKALIDLNIAPGVFRNFLFEKFDWIDSNLLKKEKRRAETRKREKNIKFYGFDIDHKMLSGAKENIKNAGLESYINLDFKNYLYTQIYGSMITNPPYGKRIKSQDIKLLYKKLFNDLNSISCGGVITGFNQLDKIWFSNLKNRLLSNGGDKVRFFYKNYI